MKTNRRVIEEFCDTLGLKITFLKYEHRIEYIYGDYARFGVWVVEVIINGTAEYFESDDCSQESIQKLLGYIKSEFEDTKDS